MTTFDIAKILFAFGFLVLASIHDVKTREVPNYVWIYSIPAAAILTIIDLIVLRQASFLILTFTGISIAISIVIFFAVFYFGLWGGADSKALIALAILFPSNPQILQQSSNYVLPIFPITIFDNSIISSIFIVPIGIAANAVWKVKTHRRLFEGFEHESVLRRIGALTTCMKTSSSRLKPYDSIAEEFFVDEKGQPKRRFKLFQRVEEDENGKPPTRPSSLPDEVFVSIPIPMIVFITLGLALSLTLGDLILRAVSALIFRY